ncbi:MAG: DUF3916 domain-containing protein [Cyanobacteria bacterium P01_F01_bin.153]
MRRLARSDKKLRGIPRRLRSLRKWSESFAGQFPYDPSPSELYWNIKIPVHIYLVEGRYSTGDTRRQCAQQMIDACTRIKQAKPPQSKTRVTCLIAVPDMFTSEICLYFDEEYFQSFLKEGEGKYGKSERILDRSLSQELGLTIPADFHEVGMSIYCPSGYFKHRTWGYTRERWYFGEVN